MLEPAQLESLRIAFPALMEDSSLRGAIRSGAVTARLDGGQTICHEGDACTHLALLTQGSARVFKLAESGREITLYRVEPGECCILTASCMLSGRAFPATATVDSDLEAVLVPASLVKRWMREFAGWQTLLWDLLAERLGDVIGLVEEVAFRRMDERLAEYLTNSLQHTGRILNATHSQIAADLGTSREVVSRLLKDFEVRGAVVLSRGKVEVVDDAKLRIPV